MIREGPIVLDKAGSAMFLAIMSFGDETSLKFPKKNSMVETLEKPVKETYMSYTDCFGRISYSYLISNFSCEEEWEQALIPYESARIAYIYKYLKDKYPKETYAEDYRLTLSTEYWVKRLNLNVDSILR